MLWNVYKATFIQVLICIFQAKKNNSYLYNLIHGSVFLWAPHPPQTNSWKAGSCWEPTPFLFASGPGAEQKSHVKCCLLQAWNQQWNQPGSMQKHSCTSQNVKCEYWIAPCRTGHSFRRAGQLGHGCARACVILLLKNPNNSNVFTWVSFPPPYILRGKGTQGKQAGCWPQWTDENCEFFARLHAHPSISWCLRKLDFFLLPSTSLIPYSSHSRIPCIWKTKSSLISFAIEVRLLPWARETCSRVITKPSQKDRKPWVGRAIKDPVLMLIIKCFVSQRFWLTEEWDLTC